MADDREMRSTRPPALDLLRSVHDRLAKHAERLGPTELERPSFCREWSLARVYSHLGSGAEIGTSALAAARRGVAPPDPWPVWNRWDAKSPTEMVGDFAPADEAYVDALTGAAESDGAEALMIPIDGRPWPLTLLMTARLVEVALHEWDVAVVDDRDAQVDRTAARWVLTAFPLGITVQAVDPILAGRLAPRSITVGIADPTDRLILELQPSGPRLDRATVDGRAPDAVVRLPDAGAWMRLVSGRFRPGPDDDRVDISGNLRREDLYALFPGF